jgi:hypothetical protein
MNLNRAAPRHTRFSWGEHTSVERAEPRVTDWMPPIKSDNVGFFNRFSNSCPCAVPTSCTPLSARPKPCYHTAWLSLTSTHLKIKLPGAKACPSLHGPNPVTTRHGYPSSTHPQITLPGTKACPSLHGTNPVTTRLGCPWLTNLKMKLPGTEAFEVGRSIPIWSQQLGRLQRGVARSRRPSAGALKTECARGSCKRAPERPRQAAKSTTDG